MGEAIPYFVRKSRAQSLLTEAVEDAGGVNGVGEHPLSLGAEATEESVGFTLEGGGVGRSVEVGHAVATVRVARVELADPLPNIVSAANLAVTSPRRVRDNVDISFSINASLSS